MTTQCNALSPAKVIKCRHALFVFFFLASAFTGFSQAVHLGGTVRDTKGTRLPGVSVKVKGSSAGTTTDSAGTYTLNVPSAQSVLVFSAVGYTDQEIPVGNQKLINVTLADKPNNLDEVVVIGYGQTQR